MPTSGGPTWRGPTNSRVSVHSSRKDSGNTLGGDLSLGSAARGAMSQLPMCLHLKPALFGPHRRRQSCRVGALALSAVLNKMSFTFSCFSFFKDTFQCGHSAPFFSFSSSATRTTLRDGNSRNLSGRQREAELTRHERTFLGVNLTVPTIPFPVKLFQSKSILYGASWLKLVLPIGTT